MASLLCLVLISQMSSGCSSSQDLAASQPAVKLPQKTSPEIIATLAGLSKLKRVDASETDLQETAFENLKSANPNVKIEFPL